MRLLRPQKKSGAQYGGDDWEKRLSVTDAAGASARQGVSFAFWRSPLTRKIVILNLIALNFLIIGVLNQNDTRENLVSQKSTSLLTEAKLIAYSVRLSSKDELPNV